MMSEKIWWLISFAVSAVFAGLIDFQWYIERIRAYRRKNPTFPYQTTADQFFDETQFECYRALGEHIASEALDNENVRDLMND
jgi:uncharacterized short protein YbdD (DUF466 family)